MCTTDDPIDTLEYHKSLKNFKVKVLPTFRPDKAVEIGKDTFVPYIEKTGVKTYGELLEWITKRIEYFHENGCRISDHGLETVPFARGNAERVFEKRMNGEEITSGEENVFKTAVLRHCAKEYARLGWAMQLHMGPIRNNSPKVFEYFGADAGGDSVGATTDPFQLGAFLGDCEREDALPKTILYNLNPADNTMLATMAVNYASNGAKVQYGAAWWLLDHLRGISDEID